MRIIITLTHREHDRMRVYLAGDASWHLGRRQWVDDDEPERGYFEDSDFYETPEQIDAMVAKARDDR